MDVRLLGNVEVSAGSRQLPLDRPKQRCVLAVLAMRPGQLVTIDKLVDCLWGHVHPKDPRGALYTHISRLRAVLQAASGTPLRRVGSGYILDLDPNCVDLHRARRTAAEARSLLAGCTDVPDRAVELLRSACAEWGEAPLAGLTGEWVNRTRDALNQERLGLVTDLLSADLRRGRHSEVLGPLQELRASHPLHEAIAELTMRALQQAGRQADALKVFADIRQALVEEIGDEPGPKLRQLHGEILRRETEPHIEIGQVVGHQPGHERDAVRAPARPEQLPAGPSTFVGREHELAEILAWEVAAGDDRAAALVYTIDGMPGVGKTALAVQAAHQLASEFPGGQLFLDLHGFAQKRPPVEPLDALDTLLRSLGREPESIPGELDERAALYRSLTAGRRILIVLDNAVSEEQVRPLLPGPSGPLVLITSRSRLAGLDDTHSLSLDRLSPAEARELFTLVVGAERVNREPPELVAEVIDRCARLPLAIRLAASRLETRPMWPLRHLLDRLEREPERPSELAAGDQSLAMSIKMSYEHLEDEQRQLLRVLRLHPGPHFDAGAAGALADIADRRADDLLEKLVDLHLVESPKPGRYRLHDLVKGFLAADAGPDTAQDPAMVRLLRRYVASAWSAAAVMNASAHRRGHQDPSWCADGVGLADSDAAADWWRAERNNLLAAAVAAVEVPRLAGAAGQLAHALYPCFGSSGDWEACAQFNAAVLEASRPAQDPRTSALARHDLGVAYLHLGRLREAVDELSRSRGLWEHLNDRLGGAAALNGLTTALIVLGQYAEAARCGESSLAICRELDDPLSRANSLHNLGTVRVRQGRHEDALPLLQDSVRIYSVIGDTRRLANSLNSLADVHSQRGLFEEAIDDLRRALQLTRSLGDRIGVAQTLDTMGTVWDGQRRYAEALECFRASLQICRELGNRPAEAEVLYHTGVTLRNSGDPEAATERGRDALAIYQEIRLAAPAGVAELAGAA